MKAGPRAFSKYNLILVVFYAALAVALAAKHGQDVNWDLLNYHFYNPYLLLFGRFERDVHAAGVQSFFNPLVDMPFYAAVRWNVPPAAFFLSLAAVQGLALFIVHKIAGALFPQASGSMRLVVGLIAGVTAAFGAAFQTEVGNTMHDDTLSVLLLAALWLVVIEAGVARPSWRAIALSGCVAGLAVGMKLSLAPIVVGLVAGVAVLSGGLLPTIRRLGVFCAAVGCGMLATGGYWMWLMYRHFGSPLFPFFNSIFRSPYAPVENFFDGRFLPRSAFESVFYPFYWVSTQTLVAEQPFRDARFAAVFVCLFAFAVYGIVSLISRRQELRGRVTRPLVVVVVFWSISYVVWLKLFSIHRYAVPLEALAGVIVIGVSAVLLQRRAAQLAVAFAVCVALSVTVSVRPAGYGRRGWSSSYFGVDQDAVAKYSDATLLMTDFPQAYLAPLFPRSSRFVRISSNWGLTSETAMWRRVELNVQAQRRLFLLDFPDGDNHEGLLRTLGLDMDAATCETYSSYDGGFRVCPLHRRRHSM